ncbi:response regulator [Tahibacter soli]|uniref:histidine kinase n=1 Tax=Tahibacter soli TaxID=2983605 RepID=A0A9X4BHV1_9GAMM|nr:response regulator [Tahibacter soli]MDC8014580.1 response regulator [Tahibacter soli]
MAQDDKETSWLGDRPIQVKLALAFGGVLLAFVAACVGIVAALNQQLAARESLERTFGVIDALQNVALGVRETELAVYARLADSATAAADTDRVAAARKNLDAALATLVARSKDDAAFRTRALQAEQRARDWLAVAVEPILDEAARSPAGTDRDARELELSRRFGTVDRANGILLSDLLHGNQTAAREELDARTAELTRAVTTTEITVLAMLALGILVSVVALWLSGRLIVRPIRHLTGLMTRLSEHDHDIVVPQRGRRDEVGAIARALEVFKETAIGTWWRNWTKTNVNELAAALQRCVDAQSFADTLCAELAQRLKAGVAIFFAYDDERRRLDLAGSYGHKQRRHLETSYALGEGLTGQCGRERKTIVLEPVPDDYVRIHSAIGEASPRAMIALPLVATDRLLGVIEIGTFAAFTREQQQLLDELLPLVALSFDNLNRAVRTRELLERTQAQAQELVVSEEALRVQQEELRSTNDELQGKTVELEEQQQRLQASEEELRVQAEELQASNEELRQKTETLNEQKQVLEALQRDTVQKAEELARASQYKSDFLANMSHELRTPLNSMLILSRNLADNDDGRLAPDQVESARVIHDAGSNLLRLINDILDLSKIEAGKMDVLVEPCAVSMFVQSLTRTFRPLAREKELRFEVAVDPAMPAQIDSDAGKLDQIVGNLVGNAIKFTRDGEVSVTILPCPDALAASVRLPPREAFAVVVADTGIGIPQHKLDAIFGVFEQVDASTSRQFGGSGLGLSIARRLAQLLGGDIVAESTEGRGSRFTVVLPLVAQTRTPATSQTAAPVPTPLAPMPPPERANGQAPRVDAPWIDDDRAAIQAGDTVILTIEDDPIFAKVLVDLIRAKGFRALAAGDGESGHALAAHYRPTGILLDVLLPGMDGWAVMRRLRASPATRDIPVHFVSGVDESARGRELGAVGFLTKPAPREALLGAFDRLLANEHGRQRSVLVIDDDPDAYAIVETMIASPNVRVENAHTGREGLDALRERQFDCLVLDLTLPDMSGFQFLDEYAKLDGTPPVVIHSARDLSTDESLRLRQFTDSIVVKGARSPQRLLDEVRLFLHSVRRQAESYVPRDVETGLSGRTVLVVDDDMRNIFALSKTLRTKGLNVLMAQDGVKALRQLDDNRKIELVLMDIMMPGMDGYEAIREIRKRPQLAKLPVIAITAKAMRGDRDRCIEAGANDYLSKPLDIDKLLSMMRVWLHA